MKIRWSALLIIFLMVNASAKAQYNLPFGFKKTMDVSVKDSLGVVLPDAWAGGLNACQFGRVDLDGDGWRDLVVFDRHGNRTLTYKNKGITGFSTWQYAPELARKLPAFSDWVIFADYNMDGRNDIFAYSKGYAGIKVYKNTGNPDAMFDLVVYPYLKSFQGGGYVNVLVTYADYPAIYDLDGDGDLDLLTFWGLGSFVELHRNESMELYGNPDSLIFTKTENCWGRFAESEESNVIYLDTCFDRSSMAPEPAEMNECRAKSATQRNNGGKGDRHTGSTFMIFDENGDGLYDLLLGDVDYSSPALLLNGGTPEDALMVSHSFSFPDYNTPVNLLSFPVMNYLDLNNDGTSEMVVSVFDPSLVKSRHLQSIWLYENNGASNSPDFNLTSKSFLQDRMLDFGAGAVPVFFDHNHDGLTDIVVANYGYFDSAYYGPAMNLYCNYRSQLALLENTGSASKPAFRLVTKNYINLPAVQQQGQPVYGAVPAFADLDGDGDEDLLVGTSAGSLLFYRNVAAVGADAQFSLVGDEYQNINPGSFSAPQLFDLDGDGLTDLVIGKRNGTISYYRNTGSAADPQFTPVTDSLGRVDVRDPNLSIFGYCKPHFFRKEDKTYLFAGSEFGQIFFYEGIDGNLDGKFKLVMKNYLWIDEGWQSAVAVGNLDGDVFPDMIVGNYAGGLSFFEGTEAPPAGVREQSRIEKMVSIRPNPADGQFEIRVEGSADLTIGRLRIFTFSGKEIYTKSCKNDRQVNVNCRSWPEGVYLLEILLKDGRGEIRAGALKLIIQHPLK